MGAQHAGRGGRGELHSTNRYRPDAMLKAVVRGPGKDKVSAAKLLDATKSLELWRVDKLHTERVQLNVTMHLRGREAVCVALVSAMSCSVLPA